MTWPACMTVDGVPRHGTGALVGHEIMAKAELLAQLVEQCDDLLDGDVKGGDQLVRDELRVAGQGHGDENDWPPEDSVRVGLEGAPGSR